jgi:hypothetical protein
MRITVAAIAIIWLTGQIAGAAQAEPLGFAGFQRNMDLAALADRFPRSQHDISPGDGARPLASQDDPKAQMRDFLRAGGSGSYVVRLTAEESFDHVFYVQADIRKGVTERLWLLLESPVDPAKHLRKTGANEARYPACNGVLKRLVAAYGKPDARAPYWEEALQHFDHVWTQSPDTLKLECGRYQGRKPVFAIGVTFEQSAARR